MINNQTNFFVSQEAKQALSNTFDTKSGIARFAGKEVLYYKSLLKFIENYYDVPKSDDQEEDRRMVHTVKGVAGNLGINQLFELAKELLGDLTNQSVREKYLQVFDEVADIIQKNIKIINSPETIRTNDTKDVLIKQLDALVIAINSYQIEICESIINKLSTTNWDVSTQIDFTPLNIAVENYDYSSMEVIVSQIRKNL